MKDIVQKWEAAAAVYAESQELSELAESNKAVVKARFERMSGERVLDLGCGYGYYSDYFAGIGANAVGIDGSEKMIEIARERYPNLAFYVADIEKTLPLENESFDIVFSNQVLMDIGNVDFVFSECKRVLKNGGIFYFSIVHPCFYDGQWVKEDNGYKSAKAIDKYISCYRLTNRFWGETAHFHRPLSFYLNIAAKYGFMLKQALEPVSYDGIFKNKDLPLFFFAEYVKY